MNKKSCRYLHLSYDAKDLETHFKTYSEARKFILFVISSTFPKLLTSPNKFTFLIEYEGDIDHTELINYFDKNLSEFFFYSISVVAEDKSNAPLFRDKTDATLLDKLNKDINRLKRTKRTNAH